MTDTDIVERLREEAAQWVPSNPDFESPTGVLITEAADEIERLRAQTTWQPIETAPMDRTEILGYVDVGYPAMGVMAFDPSYGWVIFNNGKDGDLLIEACNDPTDWMLKPKPPEKETP